MSVYSVRLNDRLSEIIDKNAREQGIASRSVYIRSLVEKGLVVDAYIQDGKLSQSSEKSLSLVDIRLAQILVENLAVCREILKLSMKSDEEFKNRLAAFKHSSQEFVMDLIKASDL